LRTDIPEKLLRIASDIDKKGPQNLTRLTVLKRWFNDPLRLSSFAIFIARRACSRKGKTKGVEATLFKKTSEFLKNATVCDPYISADEAKLLLQELSSYQSEYQKHGWNTIRTLKNHNLYLIEEGLRIYLWNNNDPSAGYRLAVSYCEHYAPAYGTMLDEKSLFKIEEIIKFMFSYEGLSEFGQRC
jgi:hypothetical protein